MKNGVLNLAPFFMAALFCRGEIPPEILAGLTADEFKQREASQFSLLKWAREGDGGTTTALLQTFKKTDDPELRRRTRAVLKELSDRDYLSDGSGYLGINMQEELFGQAELERPRFGIRILGVMQDAPAARAGLKNGDLILGFEGETWHDLGATTQFADRISKMKPLAEVTLLVQRGAGAPEEMKVVLGRRPIENLSQARESLQLLDEQARERHFREWLKRRDAEG